MNRSKEKLLELRKQMKKKQPKFRRVESWRYKRVKDSWRKARGIDSKTRKKTKSGVKSPNIGYRTPKKIRGMHPSGYEEVRIITKNDLEGLDPKRHALKISGRLGARKRIPLIDFARNKGFKVLNIGISQRELDELEAIIERDLPDIEEEELL
ncbi:MAG: 50S ribosomal protein L32e [Promethearchaeota archaeon]|nr:MAG: 50S ribosomal protein L32e [Candidatus Lokiarchaeota archaeon]